MICKITIDMGNDAFCDTPGFELARILRGLADRLDGDDCSDGYSFVLSDINGNSVGTAEIS